MSDAADALESLRFALDNYPEKVSAIPVDRLLLESARQNDRRPAYVKLAVPDDVAKSLRGPAARRRDILLLVSVPHDVAERATSRIILPNEQR